MSWSKFASKPCWCSIGTKLRFCSQPAKVWALFQHLARGSIHFMTILYALIHWGYLGPSRHPPSLLPILQTQLDSLRNHMQVAPNFSSIYTTTIMMYARQKIPPPLYNELGLLTGFWAALNVLCWRRSSWAAAGLLQVRLWEGMRNWEYGTLGEIFFFVLQWGCRLLLLLF